MGIPGSANPMLFGGAAAYQINQSLRFDGSAYLNRTPASAGNRRTWTWSGWVKLGRLTDCFLIAAGSSRTQLYINGSSKIQFFTGTTSTSNLETTALLRDPSAWYHIVVAVDTTQATNTNRVKFYVNGTQLTDLSTTSYPAQNLDTEINNTTTHWIGQDNSSNYASGYFAEVNFIDGTALTPSSFGETDTITGAWIPKKYSGSYGTNGFYLKFEGSGIGTDSSGNGNTWTANNFSTSGTGTDVMSDTPTNNYCTWNPINKGPSAGSYGSQLSDGNLVLAYNRTAGDFYATSTFGLPTTGKWYWEQRLTSTGSIFAIMGIAELNWTWNVSPRVSYFSSGKIVTSPDGSSDAQTGLSTYTTGDVIGHAWDADAGTLQFYKNGTAVGNPQAPTTTSGITFAIAFNAGSDTGWTTVLNCGQRAFEQTPPTGYKALNTANLPEPTIKKGGAHFNTVLWSGNGSTSRSISGVGFAPDLVWAKDRSGALSHVLQDRVRGAGDTILQSNNTASETAQGLSNGYINAFTSDGFDTTSSTANQNYYFNSGSDTYVAWNWKANGAGSSNTAGTITSTVSANASAGFSIVTWTAVSGGGTIGHGLGVAPSMVIVKSRNTGDWNIYHKSLGNTQAIYFTTGTPATSSVYWNNTSPTSSVFTVGSAFNTAGNLVSYCFSEVAGYSKFGSYTGNGSSDGPFVFCGFRPAWILVKASSASGYSWICLDTQRDSYNVSNNALRQNLSDAELTNTLSDTDLLSNGFKLRTTWADMNSSGTTYIFAAFAELPAKYSNAR